MTELNISTPVYGLPIGISDFEKLIRSQTIFVDKSLFIKDLLLAKAEVSLITRPRRFGKTLNLSMLNYFFQLEQQYKLQEALAKGEDYSLILNNYAANKSEPQYPATLFNGLKIQAEADICQAHQNQYPVIFISFKDVKASNFESAYKKICSIISELYITNEYLLADPAFNFYGGRKYYEDILNKNSSIVDIGDSIAYLMANLKRKFGRNVILLIDEYDTPLQSAYLHDYYQPMKELLAVMLSSALKDNLALQRAVLTGITRISQASLFSGLNNIQFNSVLRENYGASFGFTEAEVVQLVESLAISKQEDFAGVSLPELMVALRSWYNGYQIGRITVYNPWSIISCLDLKFEFSAHWLNTSEHALLGQLLRSTDARIKAKLNQLMSGDIIEQNIADNLVFSELATNPSALWSLLVSAGYLTVRSIIKRDLDLLVSLQIPNKEVSLIYDKIVTDWFNNTLTLHNYYNFLQSLINWDLEQFKAYIQEYLLESVSYYDLMPVRVRASAAKPGNDLPFVAQNGIASHNSEQVFHTLLLGLVAGLRQDYVIQSNREDGHGRCDLLLVPKSLAQNSNNLVNNKANNKPENRISIIIELKLAKTQADLAIQAKQAIIQIKAKKYFSVIQALGAHGQVHLLGLAFFGKEVAIESEFINL